MKNLRYLIKATALGLLLSLGITLSPAVTHAQNGSDQATPTLLELVLLANGPGGAFEGQLDTLTAALLAADSSVIARLGGAAPSTVFVPTDSAFAAIGFEADNIATLGKDTLTRILLYHVTYGSLPSSTVLSRSRLLMLNDLFLSQSGGVLTDTGGRTANIVAADVEAANGIAHVIDAVVLPYDGLTLIELLLAVNSPGGPLEGQFDTLIAAVLVADPSILSSLGGFGQLTVFLPTDAAFAELELDPMTVGDLDKDFLTDVLLYHVKRFRLTSDLVVALPTLRMASGEVILQSGGVLTDNLGRTANIIAVDVPAANGIVHVIDRVVLPAAP